MPRNWHVCETPFQPERLNHLETLFTIGNGYLGVRGTFEEGYPNAHPLFLIHGLFDRPDEGSVPELVDVPSWLGLDLSVDGMAFHLDQGEVLGYERTLDLRCGVLRRVVLWRGRSGTVMRLVFERFASLAHRHVLAMRVLATPLDGAPAVEASSTLGKADVAHWTDIETGHDSPDQIFLQARTHQSGHRLGMAVRLHVDTDCAAAIQSWDGPSSVVRFTAKRGRTVTLTKLVAVHTSRDAARPLAAARQTLQAAADLSYETLYDENAAAWDEVWRHSDVEIEGDDFAQLAIRFALYHLLIAAPRDDERASIGARTLSGCGYRGHVFWDTEAFALTPLIYTQPALARNLLMYRYHLLPGARVKAAAAGWEGAMFPWESADTGEETTPRWASPGPDGRRERIWTGEREIHISASVAYAVDRYWHLTGDDDFMARYGAEIVIDGAVFWGSRAEYDAAQDRFEFTHVIGPDEYHEDVNNSVFTNAMARWHLRTALRVLEWLEQDHRERAEELRRRLKLTPARLAHWREVIAKMYVPTDGDILVQCDGFFDLEPFDVAAYQPRMLSLQSIYGTPTVNRAQIVKQADVIMLIALLGEELGPPERLRANWEVYAPRCDHGSSLSAAVHSLVAARLGLLDQAYALWRLAASVDLENNQGNTAEGFHAAAAGGLWQATVLGFAGLHLRDGEVTLDPHLPPHWRRLSFRFFHRGRERRVTVTHDGAQVS